MTSASLPLDRSDFNETFERRFWSKVNKNGPGECWIWTSRLNHSGYGSIAANGAKGRRVAAHQASFVLAGNEVHVGMQLDHICENPSCVNPSHLREVTAQENIRNTRGHGASGYRGVSWHKKTKKWRAYHGIGGHHKSLGYFSSKEEAANAVAMFWRDLGNYRHVEGAPTW